MAMHKILAIATLLTLSGTAWAADGTDRSKLSYEENAIINNVCAPAMKQGVGSFNGCVAKQIASLHDHPTPDRSGLSPSRSRAIARTCNFRLSEGIAPYNDCLRKAMAAPAPRGKQAIEDELTPNFGKAFAEDDADEPQPTRVAMVKLPVPRASLAHRPDHIGQKALSAAELFKRVQRSVYIVLASRSVSDAHDRDIMQGSAVAVSEHLLLTNCHVVMDRPLIKLIHGGQRAKAKLVAADDDTDRCVIKTDIALTPVGGVRTLDSLAVGERVFAIGAPLSLELTLSEGLVSGIRREPTRNLVQTSAPLSPGSSGGGLFDERGNLVGITTLASINGAQNLNFAIAAGDWWR
jgi:S1-C subfamily serine protease